MMLQMLDGVMEQANIILDLERNSSYYLFKILVPIFLILLISGSVFWIVPFEVESRLTVTIVCLLALIAYNFVVDNDLPKLAYLTIMDTIILISYVFSCYPTFETIAVFHYHKKNPKLSSIIDEKSKIYFPLTYIFIIVFVSSMILSKSDNLISAFSFF